MSGNRFEVRLINWITRPDRAKFGFAVTPDGREIYVGENAFTRTEDLARVLPGSRLSVTIRPKSNEQRFRERLNAGFYRDAGLSHRNPRPPRDEKVTRPMAATARLLDEDYAYEN
jgi:hypothetical protein